jgi:toxin CcdB
MAQFDVHRNQGLQRDTMPFVVLVQSGKYDSYRGRVVVPLVRRSALSATTPTVGSRLNPVLSVQGLELVLHPLDMGSVAVDQLGDYVASLASQGELIVQALNELLGSTSA